MAAPQDVSGDGRADLVIHIVTSAIRLDVGLVEAVMTAATFGGQQITGSDWVKVVPDHRASDVTPPTGSIVSGPAPDSAFTSAGAVGDYAILASDDSFGFSATPLHVIVTRTNAAGTSCVIGSGAGCAVPALRPLTFDPLNGAVAPVNEGYYSVTITLVDQAGNSTNLITGLVFLLDDPVQIAPGAAVDIRFSGDIMLPSLIAGAVTNTFAAFAVDDIDLRSIWGVTEYPTARIRHPIQTTGTYGLPLESGASAVSYSVTNWIRCLNSSGDFTTTTNRPSQITFTALDQAGNAVTQPTQLFGANAQVCGTVGNTSLYSFGSAAPNYGIGGTKVDIDGLNLSTGATTTVALSAVAATPLFDSAIPFSRVDFYYQTSGGQLVLIGTGGSTLMQTPINRFWNYSFVWNPNADVQAGIVSVVAVGVDDQGDAVMSNAVALVVVP